MPIRLKIKSTGRRGELSAIEKDLQSRGNSWRNTRARKKELRRLSQLENSLAVLRQEINQLEKDIENTENEIEITENELVEAQKR